MVEDSTPIVIKQSPPPFLVRASYFLLVGWWLTLSWVNFAWAANVTVIGLPLGLWMLNRVPQILTLKPMAKLALAQVEEGRVVAFHIKGIPQRHWLLRLIYFALIGWWASLLWVNVAWFLCAIIIGIPFGIWMFNRLPAITTLMRTEA